MDQESRLETTDIVSGLRQASISGASAVMRVEVVGDVGYVFLLNGELVHASTLDLEGEAALQAILSWGSGTLAWCERRWPRERSVHLSWAELRAIPEPVALPRSTVVAEPAGTEPAAFEPAAFEPAVTADDVHFPSSIGIRRALAHADCKSALWLTSSGALVHSAGDGRQLKQIVTSSLLLGDSLGEAFGIGPILAAEACVTGLHRLVIRSSDESSIVESGDGAGLELARAFLKL